MANTIKHKRYTSCRNRARQECSLGPVLLAVLIPQLFITSCRALRTQLHGKLNQPRIVPGAVLLTTPTSALLLLQQVVFGRSKLGSTKQVKKLNKLKNSVRNSMPTRSSKPNIVRLKRARSNLACHLAERPLRYGPSLPLLHTRRCVHHSAALGYWLAQRGPGNPQARKDGSNTPRPLLMPHQ